MICSAASHPVHPSFQSYLVLKQELLVIATRIAVGSTRISEKKSIVFSPEDPILLLLWPVRASLGGEGSLGQELKDEKASTPTLEGRLNHLKPS